MSRGSIEPKVRVTLIPNAIPTELLEDIRTFLEETIRDEGVLCLSATGERIFIARDNVTEGWCDKTQRCKKGGFCVTIKFNFTANMSSAQVTRHLLQHQYVEGDGQGGEGDRQVRLPLQDLQPEESYCG